VATIADVTVFVFDADGQLTATSASLSSSPTVDNPAYLTTNAGAPYVEVGVTTNALKVIAIGNLGSDLTDDGALLGDVATEADLYAKLVKLDATIGSTKASHILSGTGTIDWTVGVGAKTDDDGNLIAEVEVMLTPISAKLNVTVDLSEYQNFYSTDGDPSSGLDNDRFTTFTSVDVLYSAAFSHYFADGSSKPFIPTLDAVGALSGTPAYYFSGLTSWPDAEGNTIPADGVSAQLAALATTVDESASTGKIAEQTFYVFPSAAAPFTIVTLVGTFDDGSESQTVYFPVHFSGADRGLIEGSLANIKPLENGKIYDITLKLTGSASTIGPDTPELPVTDAYLTVTVTAQEWQTGYTVVKEFE
jgi:hypothetical protein